MSGKGVWSYGFSDYLWVVVKVPCILVRSSGRVTLDCLTFINAFFIYSSFDAETD
jgi:hypothetical protein